ncbi:MAG: lytic murein transglycosylase B [Chromatiales bacterium]|nr:lytic murein transglycosylase B [Chromatiales bacterium]
MVDTHGFDREKLQNTLAGAELRQDILDLIARPAEGKPWHEYRQIFLDSARIDRGVDFWNSNAKSLEVAADRYGVPPEIIVAILGVETRYGGYKGRHRVLDALATLAFAYPKRSTFFTKELEQFLLLTREEGMDPAEPIGSYAGAMGTPQFMPSSFRSYAVDFDGDGKRDIWSDAKDTVGSVANYFQRHGWRRGEPIVAAAQVDGDLYQRVVNKGRKPQMNLADLKAAGVKIDKHWDDGLPATLMELDGVEGPEHWVGLYNFYVITRYNHSVLYALAVYQLSQEIAAERQRRASLLGQAN